MNGIFTLLILFTSVLLLSSSVLSALISNNLIIDTSNRAFGTSDVESSSDLETVGPSVSKLSPTSQLPPISDQQTVGSPNDLFMWNLCKQLDRSNWSVECDWLQLKFEGGLGPRLDCSGDKADYDPRCPGYGTPGSGNTNPNTEGGDQGDGGGGSPYACDAPEEIRSPQCDTNSVEYDCIFNRNEEACKELEEDDQGSGGQGWVGPSTDDCLKPKPGFNPPHCVEEP